MPALQSSGQISFLDIANNFGGTQPHSIDEYYRGGGLVSEIREPSSGYNYSSTPPSYYWSENQSVSGVYLHTWNGTTVLSGGLGSAGLTSWTNSAENITYYRDAYQTSQVDGYSGNTYYYYGIYRLRNIGIPQTGQISLNNFYGGYKP